MNEQQKIEKLNEILADKAFVEKLLGIETAEDVQKALNEKGLTLSLEEISWIRDAWTKQAEGADEIDAGDLRKVAGGTYKYIIDPEKYPHPINIPFDPFFPPSTQRRW